MEGGKLLGLIWILIGTQFYIHPKSVMYGFQIDWSYMYMHKIIALVFILLGAFILYRNSFYTK